MWRLFLFGLIVPLFAQLTLEEAECLALKCNKDVLVREAEEGRLISLSRWWPQVELMSRGYKTERRQFITNTKSAFLSQVSTTQALYTRSQARFDLIRGYYGLRHASGADLK